MDHLFAAIARAVADHAESMVERYAASRVRSDRLVDDLQRIFEPLLRRWGQRALILRPLVDRVAKRTSEFHLIQFARQTRHVAGIDPMVHVPGLADEMALFTRENAGLIKDIGETAIARVERVVTQGVRAGDSTKALTAAIKDELGVAERRAKLIAVDQIGKLNGKLSELRQRAAGIEKYRWRGVLDRRERPAHLAREGQVFSWDKPPSDGHPGEPVRCRCIADPVLDLFADLLDDPTEESARLVKAADLLATPRRRA